MRCGTPRNPTQRNAKARLGSAHAKLLAARLSAVYRFLAIFLLALLPLQFSWADVASYRGHDAQQAAVGHFGHHEHQHQNQHAADVSVDAAEAAGAALADEKTPAPCMRTAVIAMAIAAQC